MSNLAVTGREYLRVSLDRSGRQKSTTEQHGENAEAAERRGVTLLEPPYKDNNRSASRYAKKTRDDFEQLLDDLQHGKFGAQELWLWESSRGSRKVAEWVTLIEACEAQRVMIYVTTHARLYDPANPRDRRTLLEDAVDSEYESAKTSKRVQRDMRAAALRGMPHGKNLYGYTRVYDPKTRDLIAVEFDEEQAAVLREAAQRFMAGESFYTLAANFNERGIRPPYAKRWYQTNLSRMLKNPAYNGRRIHAGKDCGDAIWPPLFTDEEWLPLQARLADPTRRTRTGSGEPRHLLSGIARCGACGAPMKCVKAPRAQDADKRVYMCSARFCASRLQADVDAWVGAVVVEKLSRPDALAAFLDDEAADVTHLRREVRVRRERLTDAYASAAKGEITYKALGSIEAMLNAEIEQLEAEARRASLPKELRGLDLSNVADRWDDDAEFPPALKRQILRAFFDVRIYPTGRGRRRFDPSKVTVDLLQN